MEIKYADNVTLTVEITDQMVKDFKRSLRCAGSTGRAGKESKE